MKRGEFTTTELLEIVLAAAAGFVLIALLYNLIAPSFNKEEKTAESYLNSFTDAVKVADEGGTGVFSMWQPSDIKYSLVYFGTKSQYEGYSAIRKNQNTVCVCYNDGSKTTCEKCSDLDYPAKYKNEDLFALEQGKSYKINKASGENFYRINDG